MPCDYNKYPPNWHTEIRPRILARAQNCCEFPGCGLENNHVAWSIKRKGFPAIWVKEKPVRGLSKLWPGKPVRVVLTIAHLDHDPENHNVKDERLRAYCQLHHLQHDAGHKAAKRILAIAKESITPKVKPQQPVLFFPPGPPVNNLPR